MTMLPWQPSGWNLALYQYLHGSQPPAWMIQTAAAAAEAPLWLIMALAGWRLRARYRVLALALTTIALCIAVETTIGWVHPYPRPFAAGFGPAWVHHAANNAFPSTHVSIAMVLTLVLGLHGERAAAFGSLALALLMGWARIYVGIHWPADVLGAALLATLCVLLGETAFSLLVPATRRLPHLPIDDL